METSASALIDSPPFRPAPPVRDRSCVTTAACLARLGAFFALLAASIWSLDFAVNEGLRNMHTSIYGMTNRLVDGKINALIVVSGSSRAASHYDPRIIASQTGLSAVNLGRNGSQTDMQIAVLKTYLEHNRKPELVIHNLDGFSFESTREVYNAAQYVPYLRENNIYDGLKRIDPEIWKSRYMPLYGYVAADMSFAWVLGLKALVHWPQRETLQQGFDPRPVDWSGEFQQFKAENPRGISWPVEPEGVRLVNGLAETCRRRSIQLILVYSPEYTGIQNLTLNRSLIFSRFREIAGRHDIPLWDYSDWKHAEDTAYFANSEHLNARGAKVFSEELGVALQKHLRSPTSKERQPL